MKIFENCVNHVNHVFARLSAAPNPGMCKFSPLKHLPPMPFQINRIRIVPPVGRQMDGHAIKLFQAIRVPGIFNYPGRNFYTIAAINGDKAAVESPVQSR